MKYNVPLHSWKHSALTASSLWATVGAKYMSTCQTETSISGAAMLVYSTQREGERGEGNPPKTCGKTRTSHTAVSQKRLTSAHAAQPGRVSLILWSTREKKKKKATLKCIRGECRKRGRWRASSSLPAGTIQSQTLTSPAARLNKFKKKIKKPQRTKALDLNDSL